jgi:hypothetical protein
VANDVAASKLVVLASPAAMARRSSTVAIQLLEKAEMKRLRTRRMRVRELPSLKAIQKWVDRFYVPRQGKLFEVVL